MHTLVEPGFMASLTVKLVKFYSLLNSLMESTFGAVEERFYCRAKPASTVGHNDDALLQMTHQHYDINKAKWSKLDKHSY